MSRQSPPRSRRARLAAALNRPRPRTLMRRLPGWRGVLVLNYHRVGDHASQPWDHSLWSASAALLDGQLSLLAAEAEVIGPGEIEHARRENARGRRVLITFDDGYRDNFEIAFPLLRRHGLTATFFLATDFIDRPNVAWWDEIAWMVRNAKAQTISPADWLPEPLPLDVACHDATIATLTTRYKALESERTEDFLDHIATATRSGRCDASAAEDMWMSWEMAREMKRGGMTIGGHTATHPVLSRIPRERQEEEIATGALRIEQEIGEAMRWFAYPVGSRDAFTSQTKEILTERGVELAFSFYGGFARFRDWKPLDVPRANVSRELEPEIMRAMLWFPRRLAR